MKKTETVKISGAISPKAESMIFMMLVVLIGISARIFLFPIGSGDQSNFLDPWFKKIDELGAAGALKDGVGDYMPPYFWIMIAVNALPFGNKIYGLKCVSGIADLIAAIFVRKIVVKLTGSETKADLSFAAAFMLPTVLINSAAWGQCDSIYTLFLIMCVYYLTEKRDIAAVVCFSVSFVFKLQAIFIVPLLAVLLLKGRIRARAFIAFPAVYLAAILPSLICGRSLWSLLTVYARQAGQYGKLNMTLPNVWAMVRGVDSLRLGQAGVMFAGAGCLMFIYYFYRRDQMPDGRGIAVLAVLSVLFVPYMLPYMHERYYYPAAVMGLILVFIDRRITPLWLVIEFASVTSQADFLFDKKTIDLRCTALLIAVAMMAMFVYYSTLGRKDGKSGGASEEKSDNDPLKEQEYDRKK